MFKTFFSVIAKKKKKAKGECRKALDSRLNNFSSLKLLPNLRAGPSPGKSILDSLQLFRVSFLEMKNLGPRKLSEMSKMSITKIDKWNSDKHLW